MYVYIMTFTLIRSNIKGSRSNSYPTYSKNYTTVHDYPLLSNPFLAFSFIIMTFFVLKL